MTGWLAGWLARLWRDVYHRKSGFGFEFGFGLGYGFGYGAAYKYERLLLPAIFHMYESHHFRPLIPSYTRFPLPIFVIISSLSSSSSSISLLLFPPAAAAAAASLSSKQTAVAVAAAPPPKRVNGRSFARGR